MKQSLTALKLLIVLAVLGIPGMASAQSVWLVSPANGTTNFDFIPGLLYVGFQSINDIRVQVDDDPSFSSPEFNRTQYIAEWYSIYPTIILNAGTTYYWRIKGYYTIWSMPAETDWTSAWSFTTECPIPLSPDLLTPSDESIDVSRPVYFDWADVTDYYTNMAGYECEYNLQVDDDLSFTSPEVDINTTASTYNEDGILNRGTQYYWRVRTQYNNGCGWGEWGTAWSFTAECPIPLQPTLVSPSDMAGGVTLPVLLDWEDVAEVDYYHVMVDDDPNFLTPEVDYEYAAGPSEYSASGLLDNSTYYWKVEAYNNCGESGWSAIWRFTAACPTAEPPGHLSPSNGAFDLTYPISFSWTEQSGDVGYRIQVDADPYFGNPVYDRTLGATTVFDVTAYLDEGETYYWRVMAENDCDWGEWSANWSFTMACPVPGMPTLVSPSDIGVDIARPVHLDWEDVTDAVYYHVLIDDDPAFASIDVDYEFPAGPSEYYAAGLSENTTYYWKVQAMSGCDQGEWCTACSFTTGTEHVCGDVDVDGAINILDIVYTINYIYKNGPEPCNLPKK